jgi:ankyrin repeat protein
MLINKLYSNVYGCFLKDKKMSDEVKNIIEEIRKTDWDKVFDHLQKFQLNENEVSFSDGQLEAIKSQNLHEQYFKQLLGFVSKLAKAKDASEITLQKQQMIDYYESQILQLLDKTLLDKIKIRTAEELILDEDISQIASRYNELKDKIDIEYLMVKNDLGKSFIHHLFTNKASAEDIAFYLNKLDTFSNNIKETYLKISHDNESVEDLIRSKVTEDAYKNLANLSPLAEKIIKGKSQNVEVRAVVDTHTTSIHESVNESFRRMARRYKDLNLADRTDEDLAKFKQELEEKITLLKSENSTELMKKIHSSSYSEEEKQHVIFKYETTFRMLEDLINNKQYGSQFPIRPSAPVVHGLNMREIVAVSFGLLRDKENWQNQDNEEEHFFALVGGMYDGRRGYNIDDLGNEEWKKEGKDQNRCAGGSVNSLLAGMLDYKLASIIVINQDTIKNDLMHLLPEILSTISENKDFQEKYKADLIKWANTGYVSDELGNIIIDKFFEVKEKEGQNLYDNSQHRRMVIDGFKLIKVEEVSKVIKILAGETKENIEVKEFYNAVLQKVFVNIDVFVSSKSGEYALFLDSDDFRVRYEKVQAAEMEPILDEEEFEKAVLEYFQVYFTKKNNDSINQKAQLLLLYRKSENVVIADIVEKKISDLTEEISNKLDQKDSKALHVMIANGYLEVLKLLLEKKKAEEINEVYKFGTALHIAAEKGNLDITKLLLKKMTPEAINALSSFGITALMVATKKGNLKIIEELINSGAKIIVRKGSFLDHAINNGNLDIIKLLISKISQEDKKSLSDLGEISLIMAIEQGELDIAEVLIKSKSKIIAEDALLDIGYTKNKKDHIDIIKSLLSKMSQDEVSNYIKILFFVAVKTDDLEFIKALLPHVSADIINTVDDFGKTALCYSVSKGNLEILDALIKAGAKVKSSRDDNPTDGVFPSKTPSVDGPTNAGKGK